MKPKYNTCWVCILLSLAFCACEGEAIDTDVSTDGGMAEVQLGFSVAEDIGADTRMTATNTQSGSTSNYLGLDYVSLVPFDINEATPPISGNSQRLKKTNSLLILHENTIKGDVRKHYYTTMLIPSGTKSFLVYGRPSGGGEGATVADKYAHGSLKPSGLEGDAIDDYASSITFTPDLIADDDENFAAYSSALSMAQIIAGHLTELANASYTKDSKTIYWRNQAGNALEVFNSLTHEGNVFTISNAATLESQLKQIRDYGQYNNSDLANAIKGKVNNILSTANYNKWKAFGGISNMPDGLIAFKWDDASFKFVALNYVNSKEYLNPPIADPNDLVYPSQLWYYANSKLRTSENGDLTDAEIRNIFITDKNWTNVVLENNNFKSDFGGKTVITSQTKVVAIDNTLNYGVSRLMSSVRATKGNIPVDPEETSTIGNSSILWRGVLLTNQHKAGYDFQAVDDGMNYIVYDSTIKNKDGNNVSLPTNTLLPDKAATVVSNHGIHTLVVPSLANEKVYMIAELYNNSAYITITGHGGCVIPPQTYFYMVGELDPSKGTKPSGSTASGNKVFESDLCTKVDAKLENFEGAYNYVPDLSSPALVLGLKVDLNWQQAEPKSVWLH